MTDQKTDRASLLRRVDHTFKIPVFALSQDSVWGGTGSSSLYQSNHTSGQQQQQQQRFETVTSGKKKKKQKMVRADPSLLGESEHQPFVFPHVLVHV